jgi:hypothetical protein
MNFSIRPTWVALKYVPELLCNLELTSLQKNYAKGIDGTKMALIAMYDEWVIRSATSNSPTLMEFEGTSKSGLYIQILA